MKTIHTMMIVALLSSTLSLSAQEDLKSGPRIPDSADYPDLLTGAKKPVVEPAVPAKAQSQPVVKTAADAAQESQAVERFLAEARMHLEEIVGKSGDLEQEAKAVFDEAMKLITERLNELELKENKWESGKSKTTVGADRAAGAEAAALVRPAAKSAIQERPEAGSHVPDPAAFEDLLNSDEEIAAGQGFGGKVSEKRELIREVDRALRPENELPPRPQSVAGDGPVILEDTRQGNTAKAREPSGKKTGSGQGSTAEAAALRHWAQKLRTLADQMVEEAESIESAND